MRIPKPTKKIWLFTKNQSFTQKVISAINQNEYEIIIFEKTSGNDKAISSENAHQTILIIDFDTVTDFNYLKFLQQSKQNFSTFVIGKGFQEQAGKQSIHYLPSNFTEERLKSAIKSISDNNNAGPISFTTDKVTALTDLSGSQAGRLKDESIKDLLSLAIEQSTNMVVITDKDGNIIYVNHHFMQHTGFKWEDISGKHIRILKSGFHDQLFYQKLWEQLKCGKTWSGEFRNKKKDGNYYWEHASISPVFDTEGHINYYLAIKRDISHEKRQEKLLKDKEQKLIEANETAVNALEAKNRFLSFISHEIRNPLNAVISVANLLAQTKLDIEQKELMEVLNFSSDNLMALINDVLDLNKMEAGKAQFETIPVDLNQMCSRIVATHQPKAREKGLSLSFIPLQGSSKVKTDILRLTQVLNNIIGNALKFTQIGEILLELKGQISPDGQKLKVLFSVKDTGKGISKDKIENIFEPYTQEKAQIARQFGGTGLGLSISKKIIEGLGGSLSVESTEGTGSKFYFTLEMETTQIHESLLEDQSQAYNTSNIENLKVLLVEDSPMNILIMEKFFRKWMLRFRIASSGKECFDWLKQEQFDLVLLDIYLPDMDGFEISSRIRASVNQRIAEIPIIGLTAASEHEINEKAIAMGMNDMVLKPFKPQVLVEKMARFAPEPFQNELKSKTEDVFKNEKWREIQMKKLVDIDSLKEIAGDDLELFVQTIIFSLEALRTNYLEGFYKKNSEQVQLARHNLYPTLRNFGMEKLETLIEAHKQFQQSFPQEAYKEPGEAMVLEIIETCKEIVQYLEEQVKE